MNAKLAKADVTVGLTVPRAKAPSVNRFFREVGALIRLEPTCIKCGCTEFNACDEGCSWSFLNKKTNEGICSSCLVPIATKAGLR